MSRRQRRRRGARRARNQAPPAPSPARAMGGASRALRAGTFAALGLLLLTPFIVDVGSVFPYVVPKSLWARALIEVAFALWALLALLEPRYRPPRSWLLVLAVAGLAVAALSGALGVSPEHSLWTNYERMHGVVDRAHWVALAFVAASVLRGPGAWRALLGAHAAAGAALALIVISGAAGVELPLYGQLPGRGAGRLAGPLGNPILLSVCMLANAGLAAAFCARAASLRLRPATVGWAALAALNLAGLVLAGSVGGLVGLAGAVGFAALAFAWLARGRRRLAAAAVLAVLAAGTLGLGARFLDPGTLADPRIEAPAARWPGAPALRYVARVHVRRPSVQSRYSAWEAGLRGFAERPLLGWGPGNYNTVFGLHGTGYAATAVPHDHAHGQLVEVAATTGAAGLLAWLALWGLALAAPVGAARAMKPPDRAFAVFAAAALAGHLVQLQFLFDTVAGLLFSTLLLAFAARLESRALPRRWRPRLPGGAGARLARLCGLPGGRPARVLLGAAAVSLALWGLAVNRTILSAADARHLAPNAVPSGVTAEGIDAFPPLAGFYRRALFIQLAENWARLREVDPEHAARLLAWADREADAAVHSQPVYWRVEHELARLYRAAAGTDPQYADRARRHLERATALAPARDPFPAPLARPADLRAAAVPADPAAGTPAAVELSWTPTPGAGYHRIARSNPSGRWTTVMYAYGFDPPSFLAAPCEGCRHRIRACRNRQDCSAWAVWP